MNFGSATHRIRITRCVSRNAKEKDRHRKRGGKGAEERKGLLHPSDIGSFQGIISTQFC